VLRNGGREKLAPCCLLFEALLEFAGAVPGHHSAAAVRPPAALRWCGNGARSWPRA